MKKITGFRFLFVPLFLLLVFASGKSVSAAENGGAVQTNGVISFYDDTVPSTSEPMPSSSSEPISSESSTSEPQSSSSEKPIGNKPSGQYPSTGELVKASLSISGAVLILAAGFFFLWKRKKEKGEG